MHQNLILTFLLFIISIIICDDKEMLKELRKKQFQYIRLEFNINIKICDESTFSGVLNYDEVFLNQIDECEHLQDVKLPNNSYIRTLCKKENFLNQNHNQVMYNTRCNKTESIYQNCVFDFENNVTTYTQTNSSTDINKTVEHYEQLFKKKEDIINCYKKALNTDIVVNDKKKILGEYAFVRFRLIVGLERNKKLMTRPYTRKETFSNQTEDKKYADFIKCYDLLSTDCFEKFNSSNVFELEFETRKKYFYNHSFKIFIIEKMQFIPNIVKLCQSEKYATIKIKDYYEKEGKNLLSLIDCQINALRLSENEKLKFPSEQQMRKRFDY